MARVDSRRYGGRPNPRRANPRVLHLKLRVVLTRPMTASEARARLDRAVATRRVPPGIEIAWIDWQKGTTGKVGRGRIAGNEVYQALRDFHEALVHSGTGTRFARVREEG